MPQIQPIVVGTRTFSPVRHEGNVVFYRDMSNAVPALRPTLSISLSEPSKTSKLFKARVRMTIPVPEVIGEDPTGRVTRLNSFDLVAIYDAASTATERGDVTNSIEAFVGTDEFGDVIQSLLPLY